MARTAVIAGVGPGLGASLARRFAAEGCAVALLARTESFLEDLASDLDEGPGAGLAVPTDLRDADAIRDAFETVRAELGPVDVLVNHASASAWEGLRGCSVEAFDEALAVGPRAGFVASKEAAADMLGETPGADADGGTIIFTGATTAVRGRAGAVDFSAAKFGVRGLAQSMAQELGPEGVHVAHVVLDGGILPPDRDVDDPESYLDPDDIADAYWDLVETDGVATMSFEVHVTNGNGTVEFL